MSISLYSATVPVLVQLLTALSEVLKKGEAFAHQRKFDPATLLQSRLFPDMLPLVRQVQIACDFAQSVPFRIAGLEVAAYEDTEQSFAELQSRISKTLGQWDPRDCFAPRHAKREKTICRRLCFEIRHATIFLPHHDLLQLVAPKRR